MLEHSRTPTSDTLSDVMLRISENLQFGPRLLRVDLGEEGGKLKEFHWYSLLKVDN